jgi:hypothetical protein
MKKIHCSFLIALLVTIAACASGTGSNRRVTGSTSELASMLAGRYQAEGTGLRLDISSLGTRVGEGGLHLFTTVTGALGGQSVQEAAVLHLENDGGDIRVTIVPELDSTASPLSPGSIQSSQLELNSACVVYLQPVRQGYEGTTEGSGTCIRAIQGATGQWTIQVQDDTIRLTGVKDRQTLVFREAQDRSAQ